jgi:hypothetical protein
MVVVICDFLGVTVHEVQPSAFVEYAYVGLTLEQTNFKSSLM